jgi:hypothetical protein
MGRRGFREHVETLLRDAEKALVEMEGHLATASPHNITLKHAVERIQIKAAKKQKAGDWKWEPSENEASTLIAITDCVKCICVPCYKECPVKCCKTCLPGMVSVKCHESYTLCLARDTTDVLINVQGITHPLNLLAKIYTYPEGVAYCMARPVGYKKNIYIIAKFGGERFEVIEFENLPLNVQYEFESIG